MTKVALQNLKLQKIKINKIIIYIRRESTKKINLDQILKCIDKEKIKTCSVSVAH